MGPLREEVRDGPHLVSGFKLRVSDFGFRVSDSGLRFSGFGIRVAGFGIRVSGFGFRALREEVCDDSHLVSDLVFSIWELVLSAGFGVKGFGFRS